MCIKVLVLSTNKPDQEEGKTILETKKVEEEKKVEEAEVETKVEAIVEEISLANYGDFDFVWQGGFPIERQFQHVNLF